jgi:hypothetical protein
VLTYYKNKFFELINDLRQNIDLYIVGNFDGLEDGAVIETSRIFDTLYNMIWGQDYEYLYSTQLSNIISALQLDDYDTARDIFESYFDEYIKQNIDTLNKLLDAINNPDKKKEDSISELLKMYLSLKGIDVENIEQLMKNIKTNSDDIIYQQFVSWVNNIVNGLKQVIIYQIRARDSIVSTLNNPDKRVYLRDLIEILM